VSALEELLAEQARRAAPSQDAPSRLDALLAEQARREPEVQAGQEGIDRRAAIAAREKELGGGRGSFERNARTIEEEFDRTEEQKMEDYGESSAANRFAESASSQFQRGAHNVANKVDNFISDRFGDDVKGGGILDDEKFAERDRKNELLKEHSGMAGVAGRFAGDSLLTLPVDVATGGVAKLGKAVATTKKVAEHAKKLKKIRTAADNAKMPPMQGPVGPLKRARENTALVHQQKKDYWRGLRKDRKVVMDAADVERKMGPTQLDKQAGTMTRYLKGVRDEKNVLSGKAKEANKAYQGSKKQTRLNNMSEKQLDKHFGKQVLDLGPTPSPGMARGGLGRAIAGHASQGAVGGGLSAAVLADEGQSLDAAKTGAQFGAGAGVLQKIPGVTARPTAAVLEKGTAAASYMMPEVWKRYALRAASGQARKHKEGIIDTLRAFSANGSPGGLSQTISKIRDVGAGRHGAGTAREEQQ
jgi:hypothetical protein